MTSYDFLRRYLEAGTAFTQITKRRAEEVVNELVRAGELQRGQAQDWTEDLVRRSRKNAEDLAATVRKEVTRQLKTLGIESVDDVMNIVRKAVITTAEQARDAGGSALAARSGARKTTNTAVRRPGASAAARATSSPARPATSRSSAAGASSKASPAAKSTAKSGTKASPAAKSTTKASPAAKSTAKSGTKASPVRKATAVAKRSAPSATRSAATKGGGSSSVAKKSAGSGGAQPARATQVTKKRPGVAKAGG